MCGIIGYIDSKDYRKDTIDYIEMLSHRGQDSYGAIIAGDKIHTIKSLEIYTTHYKNKSVWNKKTWRWEKIITKPAIGFIDKFDKIPLSNFVLIHNRAASIGGVSEDLAHPITKENHNKISVIHNGTKKKLKEFFNELGNSDTEIIATLLSYHFSDDAIIKTTLEGTGVVFGVNHKTKQVLVHIDGQRPLFVNKERNFIASEPLFEGIWYLFKPVTKIFNSFEDFIKNAKIYKKSVQVIDDDLIVSTICPVCNKTHYCSNEDIEGRCFKCIIENKQISYTNNYNYSYGYYSTAQDDELPKGTLVEATLKKSIVIGEIITTKKDTIYIKDKNNVVRIINKKQVKQISDKYLIKDKEYLFSDNGKNWVKRKYKGASQSPAYPYYADYNGYNQVFKYIKEIK